MKVECLVRIPPDVTGKTYYEGEVYDLSASEYEKLKASGHFGAKYDGQVVEAHFVEIQDAPAAKAAGAAAPVGGQAGTSDNLEELKKDVLLDMAGNMGLTVDRGKKKEEIIAEIRAAKATGAAAPVGA